MTTSSVANANPAALAAPDDSTRWSYVGLLLGYGIVGATLGCPAGSVVDRMGPHRAALGAFAAARGLRRVS